MSYMKYANFCASMVRSCLREPARGRALTRGEYHFRKIPVANGKLGHADLVMDEGSLKKLKAKEMALDD